MRVPLQVVPENWRMQVQDDWIIVLLERPIIIWHSLSLSLSLLSNRQPFRLESPRGKLSGILWGKRIGRIATDCFSMRENNFFCACSSPGVLYHTMHGLLVLRSINHMLEALVKIGNYIMSR